MLNDENIDIAGLKINPLLEKLRGNPIAGSGENNYFESFDGTKIFYRTWKPLNELKKIIIVCHGMGGHGEFFVLLADRLVAQGVMIIAPDYRNHGLSEGKKGDIEKFSHVLKDLHHFMNYIKEKYPNIPIFLFGESMGGAVSINFANDYPEEFSSLSGLILFAPAVKINLPKVFWVGIALLILPILLIRLLFPSKMIISAKGREDQGIKDPIHQQYDREDPYHLEKISIRYLLELYGRIRKTKKIAAKISIPIIIFQGTADKGISPKKVQKFHDRITFKDKKIVLVKDGYHALLTDPCFQDKWDILIEWILSH